MRSFHGTVFCVSLLTGLSSVQGMAQDETVPTPPLQAPEAATAPAVVPPVPATAPTQAPKTLLPKAPGVSPGKNVAPAKAKLKKIRKKTKKKAMGDSLQAKRGVNQLDAAVVGEAAVLPKNVFRARYIFRSVDGERGYGSDAKKQDVGATISAVGHALALEYGLSDRWVLQLIAPYTSTNELTINANKFRQSKQYGQTYDAFVKSIAPSLIAANKCADLDSCRAQIDNENLAIGVSTPIELPTGETTTIGGSVPIRQAIDSIILKAIEPKTGKTGLGDIQLGLGYNAINTPRNVFTVGLGMRFPSGLFSNVADAYRAPGSGFLAAGLLLRYDLRLTPVVLSMSHQAEYSLNKAKRTRSSLLEPNFLNGQDPTGDNPQIPGGGDGIPNEGQIERKGIYHTGYARAAFAMGYLWSFLNPLAIYGYFNYSVDPEYHNFGHLYRKKEELYSVSYSASIDGLAMSPMIPASLTYKRDIAIGGRNALIAPNSHYIQLNGYYKF